jgi:abscisic-aldehyde oxidase
VCAFAVQVEGAFTQGLGFYTTEEPLIASDGTLQSKGTWEYKPPMASDLPLQLHVTLLEDSDFGKGYLSSKVSHRRLQFFKGEGR